MGKDIINFGRGNNFNAGPGNLRPKPMMTPRAVPKINQAFKDGEEKKWDDTRFVAEVRAEYDHKVRTGGAMGDSCASCKEGLASNTGPGFCTWTPYLKCCLATLKWRKKDIEASVKGQFASPEEVKKVHFVCDLAIKALEKELKARGVQVYT